MAPCSVWLKKKLKTPVPIKGRVYVDAPGYKFTDKTIFKYLRHEDTFYDRKSGWLCFGNKKIEVIDDVIEIMENVCVVLRDEEGNVEIRKSIGAELIGMTVCPCAQESVRESDKNKLLEFLDEETITKISSALVIATYKSRIFSSILSLMLLKFFPWA